MSKLLSTLSTWKPFRAIVLGDFMLDELVYGNMDRLANDAPVPILHVQRTEHRPGGAGNVSMCLAGLKASVYVLGVVGDDLGADALRVNLSEQGVDVSGLYTDGDRPTTLKRNLIGLAQHRHAQKVFRMDHESSLPLSEKLQRKLLDAFQSQIGAADVVCIEDYNKGVCTPWLVSQIIASAKAHNVPVLVDPAYITDYSKYRGCSTITPNRTEAQRATGINIPDSSPPEAFNPVAEKLIADLQMDAAVITLDKSGALLMERDQQGRAVPTVARNVYDVTGAGDMVLAALAAAKANGLDWFDAVRLANAAAGLEVEHFGVVAIPIEQIHRDILNRERQNRGKLRSTEELCIEVNAWRSAPGTKTVVLANGCFDVLHAGHVSLLRRAAAFGDYLVVAINSDASVRKLKGPDRPIYNVHDRAELLGALEFVDAVVVFDDDTPQALIHAVKPDVLIKGKQYDIKDIPGAAFVIENGGRVELLEIVEGRSTTSTVSKIRAV